MTIVRDHQMIDLIEADIVEITIDTTGKLWVNVDGRCLLRIRHSNNTIVDDGRSRLLRMASPLKE